MLLGIFSIDSLCIQTQFYSLTRDLQELFGHFYSVYSLPHGSFHIEEAQFHKAYYACFLANITSPKPTTTDQPSNLSTSPSVSHPIPTFYPNTSSAPSHPSFAQAEAYFKEGKLDEALKEVIFGENEAKNQFILKLADSYLEKGYLESAYKTIKNIFGNSKIKTRFFAKLARSHLNRGDIGQAFKMIKKIFPSTEDKNAFLTELAEACLKRGDFDQAFKVIKEIFRSTQAKEVFLVKLAHLHFDREETDRAYKVIKEVSLHTKDKEAFLLKLAHLHFDKEEMDHAYKVIKEVFLSIQNKEAFLAKLLKYHFEKNDTKQILDIVSDVVLSTSVNHFIDMRLIDINASPKYPIIANFCNKLSEELYFKNEYLLKDNQAQQFLQSIQEAASAKSTLQALSDLYNS